MAIIHKIRGNILVVSLLAFAIFSFSVTLEENAEAFQYTTSESAYLRQLTPILTELSQLGTKVSQNAIGLQSANKDICSNEFGFYQGIVISLRDRLNSYTPPARLKPIHIKSLEGLSDYLTGLNLYESSCVDKDYAMKSKLVNRGTEYLTKADETIITVNDLIANPDLIPASTSSEDQIDEWCGAKWNNNIKMQKYCVQKQSEAKDQLDTMLQMNPTGTPGNKIIAECSSLWTDKAGSQNYRMIVFCAQEKMPR